MPNLWKTLLIAAIVALAALLMLMGTKRSQNPSPSPPQASSVQKAEPGTPSPSNERIWQGTLSVGGTQLRLILHVTKAPNGSLTAKLDSLDQGALGLPIDRIALTDQSLQFEMTQIGASYKGTLNSDGSEIVGEWTQGGVSLPLTFKRIEQAPIVRRPQEPTKPYPYQAEDVSFRNQTASVTLAGTLTLPSGKGPFPAVILTAGSGPVDRDETVAGHRIFLVLADYLTRHGIAVLRYDKRGVGQSTGDFPAATTEDLANDALDAVAYLKNRPEINPKEIGLVGHSEGGLIAPMVVSRSSDVAFIVLMAGPGVTGEEILLKQTELILRANGIARRLWPRSAPCSRISSPWSRLNRTMPRLRERSEESSRRKRPNSLMKRSSKQAFHWKLRMRQFSSISHLGSASSSHMIRSRRSLS